MSDIEAGKIDCVLVYKVDRLSRLLMDIARLCLTSRIDVASVCRCADLGISTIVSDGLQAAFRVPIGILVRNDRHECDLGLLRAPYQLFGTQLAHWRLSHSRIGCGSSDILHDTVF